MKYSIEMASCGMMYVPIFIKIVKHSKVVRRKTRAHTFTEQRDLIGLFYFLKMKLGQK